MVSSQKKTDKPTLIVCPVSVINVWVRQFKQHVKGKDHPEVFVFHGPEVTKSKENIPKSAKVVITTYSTLVKEQLEDETVKRKDKKAPGGFVWKELKKRRVLTVCVCIYVCMCV